MPDITRTDANKDLTFTGSEDLNFQAFDYFAKQVNPNRVC